MRHKFSNSFKQSIRIVLATVCATACFVVSAHGFNIGELAIAHPYAIATVPGQANGGVFFKHIENKGSTADRLVSASISDQIASRTELHTMNTENDVMRMRQITAIEVPAKTTVPMQRGLKKDGYHVMLMDLKVPLNVGDKVPMKLKFEKAGVVDIVVNVEALKPNAAATEHKH